MKIKISNFGPIKEAELDLSKELIMVYGENSVGKSYAIQVAYLVLKALKKDAPFVTNYYYNITSALVNNNQQILSTTEDSYQSTYKLIMQKIETLIKAVQYQNKVNITEDFNELTKLYFSLRFTKELEESLESTFGTLKNIIAIHHKHPQIEVYLEDYIIELSYKDSLEVKNITTVKYNIYGHISSESSIERTINGLEVHISKKEPDSILKTLLFIIGTSVEQNINKALPKLYFLPASRSGLYTGMSAFSQIIAELSRKRSLLTSKIELPGIPEPVSDYFLELSNISTSKLKDTKYSKIAEEIEKDILKGTIGFDNHRKELNYRPADLDSPLELTASSSMVSELSSVVAFLKYVLEEQEEGKGKPVIFMEEPEAHLHPKAQVALSEIFVKLVNAGGKLVITSHSNYIFNKFNNLVIAGELKPEQYAPIILKMEEGGSRGHQMELDELGVDDENFTEVSEELYEERERLLEKLNNEEAAQ